jgi:hypothetical protein
VTGLLRVGPAGGAAAKLVKVSFLDPIYQDDTMSVGLRWEAAGPTGGLFPVLDAIITIGPEGEDTARLALAGSYRPALGPAGCRAGHRPVARGSDRDGPPPRTGHGGRDHQPRARRERQPVVAMVPSGSQCEVGI